MISELLGFDSDYIIIGLAAVCVILMVCVIINLFQTNKLKKKYKSFLSGKNAKSLEETLIERLKQIDELRDANRENEKKLKLLFKDMQVTFQKFGLVKYDAFNEMGGKLSFSLALLNKSNDGFVMNAVHSREGCYTYVKEIIDGNSVISLAEEEQEALDMAMNYGKEKQK